MATEHEKREARGRRRAAETGGRKTSLVSDLNLTDPAACLEQLRGTLIKGLLQIADETAYDSLRARILFDLLKLTSLGRTQVALTAQLEKFDIPDLSSLPPDTLLKLIEETKGMTGPLTIALPDRVDGNGQRGGTEESSAS